MATSNKRRNDRNGASPQLATPINPQNQELQDRPIDWVESKFLPILKNQSRILVGDCSNFADVIDKFRKNDYYQNFAESWESFCQEYVERPHEWVDHVCNGVQILRAEGHNGTIEFNQALQRSEQAKQLAESATPLAEHGTNQHKKEELIIINSKDGTDPQYLAARIARDRPDIQEAMRDGKYQSVRAAAVDAGIVKPRMQFTVGSSTTPQAFAASLYEKLKPDFLAALVAALTDVLTTDEASKDETHD